MADKTFKSYNYNILDADGNVVDKISLTEDMAEQKAIESEQAAGRNPYFYMPDKDADREGKDVLDVQRPTTEASVDISVNTALNTITAKGPKWLVDDVVNSETFKQNWTQNNAFKQLAAAYNANPDAQFQDAEGNMHTAAEMLNEYVNAANEFAKAFPTIKNTKLTAKDMYGVDLSDEQASEWLTGYSKELGYDSSGAVYLPDWAADNYDWTKCESYDPEKKTVSAGDFFKEVYKEDFDNHFASQLQEEAAKMLGSEASYNTFDPNDEEEASARQEVMGTSEYAEEVARTMHMYNLVKGNRPDVGAAYNVMMFTASTAQNFMKSATNAGYNVSSGIIDFFDSFTSNANADGRINFANPVYDGAIVLGELLNYFDGGRGLNEEFFSGLAKDLEAVENAGLGDRLTLKQKDLQEYWEKMNSSNSDVTSAWDVGVFAGDMAWKIAENIAILNPVGGAVGGLVSGTGKAAAAGLAKMGLSGKTVASIFNLLGKGTNIATQATLETFFDNKELIDQAFASGYLTDELKDKYMENFFWNLFGEGISDAGSWFFKNTRPGKVISQIAAKPFAAASYVTNSALHKIFSAVHKNLDSVQAAAGKGKLWEKLNTTLYAAKRDAAKAILDNPILRQATAAEQAAVDSKMAWILFGGKANMVDPETGERVVDGLQEVVDQLAKEGGEGGTAAAKSAAPTDAGYVKMDQIGEQAKQAEQVAEQAQEAAEKTAEELAEPVKMTRGEIIDKNYENYRKLVLVRMNLENNIDAISKGVSIKMSEINEYGGNTYKEFSNAASAIKTVEAGRSDLTKVAYGYLSQESSDWLSWRVKRGRFEYLAQNPEAAARAGLSADQCKEYAEQIAGKMAELEGKLGGPLTNLLEDYHFKIAAYDKSITDYLISRGYVDDEYSALIKNLRNNVGWGDGGAEYHTTMRYFENQALDKTAEDFLRRLENGEVFKGANTVGEQPFRYKLGDIDEHWVDPTIATLMKIRGAAAVAQAADLGRAIKAAAIPVKGVSEFTEDGIAKSDVSPLSKNIKAMRKELSSDFSKIFEKDINSAIKDAFNVNDPTIEAVSKLAEPSQAGKKLSEASAAERKAFKRVKAFQERVNPKTVAGARNCYKICSNQQLTTSVDMDVLFAETANVKNVPVFAIEQNVNKLTAPEFNEWRRSLGGYMHKEGARANARTVLDDAFKRHGLNPNVTNLKKLFKLEPSLGYEMRTAYIFSYQGNSIRNSNMFQKMMVERMEKTLSGKVATTYKEAVEKLQKAMGARNEAFAKYLDADRFSAAEMADPEAYGPEFAAKIGDMVYGTETSSGYVDTMISRMRGSAAFKEATDYMISKGVDKELAERYLALRQLRDVPKKQIKAALRSSKAGEYSTLRKSIKESAKGKIPESAFDKIEAKLADAYADGIYAAIEEEYLTTTSEVAFRNADALDIDDYFDTVQKQIDDIQGKGFSVDKNGNFDFDKTKYVQMISPEGKMKFYEMDPLYADLINNASPSVMSSANRRNFFTRARQDFNQIFRWGTTGIDKTSYVNQWFRDSLNAILVGGAKPFTDLGPGGFKGMFRAMAQDYIPGARTGWGKKIFGEEVTGVISNHVVDSTFEASEAGLKAMNGEEWMDAFKERVTKGLTGEEAAAAYKRAVVEYAADTTGASTLPGLGGITQAEFYAGEGGKTITGNELRKNYYDALMDPNNTLTLGNNEMQILQDSRNKFEAFFEQTSRGSFRESFLRRSVYTSQYKLAIESGMSMPEAKIWATRYALDATTDFSRTFPIFNNFIKSVPYLSASINGTRSFFRLLSLDPVGVSTRITYGITLPYMNLLGRSLSDPKNREVYMSIPEYEKEDSFVFVYNGAKISIPLPQELSPFFSPFRHAVEKMADAQDASWINLATSDVLGMCPLDLSGFLNLDANTLLQMDGETGIWAHIQRGMEKATSSLMSPVVKSAYMVMSGRDPYTGKDIDKSYTTIDADGNVVVMDSTENELARWIHDTWPSVPASGAHEILKTVLGRSTESMADDIVALMTKSVPDVGAYLGRLGNRSAEALAKPVLGRPYEMNQMNRAAQDWKEATDYLFDKRDQLKADEGLQKALNTLRTADKDSDKYKGAMTTYKSKIDEYKREVLELATNMANKYPEQYTHTRAATVLSLLTIQSDVPFSDTAYNDQTSKDAYYEARNMAINSLVRMGFPTDYDDVTELGVGHYKKNGEFEFQIFTPYQIQDLNSSVYNTKDRINAEIEQVIKDADIKSEDMWSGYYKAKDRGKSALKQYKADWNFKVVSNLYPLAQKYGTNVFLNSSSTRELLDNYIFVDNPYKAKQYLTKVFGGEY